MKSTLATTLALASTAAAQFYNITSSPFFLVLSSSDTSTDGQSLAACHTGAAIESLCLTTNPDGASTFFFNTSAALLGAPTDALGQPGILTYNVPADPVIPSAVTFVNDPSTDSALPLFMPGDERAQQLAFDESDMLNVQGYVDWQANPPAEIGGVRAYYRWFACQTLYLGYSYRTLVWGLGSSKPENPTCVSVGVKRVFVRQV